jgi:hypothetical protein
MTQHAALIEGELAILMAIAGHACGLAYFAALRRGVLLLAGGKGRLRPQLLLALGRIASAVALLSAAAQFGAAPLLAALLGFLAARALVLRAQRRAGWCIPRRS